MVDDRPEDNGPLGDAGRPRREPPTIDLKATDSLRGAQGIEGNGRSESREGNGKGRGSRAGRDLGARAFAGTGF